VHVAAYDKRKRAALMADAGLIRNRLKIDGAVQNAQAFLAVQRDFQTFDAYVWQFVGGHPIQNRRKPQESIPASTEESAALSKDLKRRGFTFVGPTICYAFMQAVGMVNDHAIDCFRHQELM
jgi:DNA-3-methyladenine glycosylase I